MQGPGSMPLSFACGVKTPKERVMRTAHFVVLATTFISAWVLSSPAATAPMPPATAAQPARITVLTMPWQGCGDNLKTGLRPPWWRSTASALCSILVRPGDSCEEREGQGRRSVQARLRSAIAPSQRSRGRIVLCAQRKSEGQDLRAQGRLWWYFGSDQPRKFYRKDESLFLPMRYYNGAPPKSSRSARFSLAPTFS